MMRAFASLTRTASHLLTRLAASGLILMTVIVGWQVFSRYILNSSPSWSEQASLTLMIWYVSLAAAAGVRDSSHIRIAAVEKAMPPSVQRPIRITSNLVVGVCGAAMCVWGTDLVIRTWSHVIPSLGLPRGTAYAGIPIAGALIVIFSIERVVKELNNASSEEEGPSWS